MSLYILMFLMQLQLLNWLAKIWNVDSLFPGLSHRRLNFYNGNSSIRISDHKNEIKQIFT